MSATIENLRLKDLLAEKLNRLALYAANRCARSEEDTEDLAQDGMLAVLEWADKIEGDPMWAQMSQAQMVSRAKCILWFAIRKRADRSHRRDHAELTEKTTVATEDFIGELQADELAERIQRALSPRSAEIFTLARQNPGSPAAELGRLLTPPVGKSRANHLVQRIRKAARVVIGPRDHDH